MLFTETSDGKWRGAGQACFAGFVDQKKKKKKKDEDGHAEDLTGDDWLADYRERNNKQQERFKHYEVIAVSAYIVYIQMALEVLSGSCFKSSHSAAVLAPNKSAERHEL